MLGVAFAAADLAFEIDDADRVAFGLGAVSAILGVTEAGLAGRPWREVVAAPQAEVLAVIFEDLAPGERKGRIPVVMRIGDHPGAMGELSVFRLPGPRGGVSCAFRRTGEPPASDGMGALLREAAFDDAIEAALREATVTDAVLRLELLETPGFAATLGSMPRGKAREAQQRLSSVLRAAAVGGYAAREVAPDRYALLASGDTGRLSNRVEHITGAAPIIASAELEGGAQTLNAIRVALDRYTHAGAEAACGSFRETLDETLRQARAFRAAVAKDDVRLVFQPVVSLNTGELHHFEALARFGADESPGDAIRLAEELDLITAFDRSVFRRVADSLATLKSASVAVNVSGRSLMREGFVGELIAATERRPAVRRRLLIELTETHLIEDLDAADRRIADLRGVGHLVCLDDFGAGAASLDYLRRLRVDMVKLD
ncbi:MAG: EAL domain-containing protein, partial [Proteobacteria bacterium]|nr:EAL domain-containing protein [Pseudomonadota bacterium]